MQTTRIALALIEKIYERREEKTKTSVRKTLTT